MSLIQASPTTAVLAVYWFAGLQECKWARKEGINSVLCEAVGTISLTVRGGSREREGASKEQALIERRLWVFSAGYHAHAHSSEYL